MQVGINVWRALRPIHTRHRVWAHIADNPLTGEAAGMGLLSPVFIHFLPLLPAQPLRSCLPLPAILLNLPLPCTLTAAEADLPRGVDGGFFFFCGWPRVL